MRENMSENSPKFLLKFIFLFFSFSLLKKKVEQKTFLFSNLANTAMTNELLLRIRESYSQNESAKSIKREKILSKP